MEEIQSLTTLSSKLDSLNNIYSIWYFNNYLRVTYVAPDWLVIWDHRSDPPQRYDIKKTGDHAAVCRLTEMQLKKLAAES